MPDDYNDRKLDLNTLGHIAADKKERRDALDYCLSQHWAAEDIRSLERRDEAGKEGWYMWRR